MAEALALDTLDAKANEIFGGKLVRKDLVRKVKVGANVPVFVLEYLLGKYCASSDPLAIQMGIEIVNKTLAESYVSPDEAMRAQAKLKEKGHHTFIDKVSVRLIASEDKYWATLANFGDKYVHIPDSFMREYERLLQGGIWAQLELEYFYDDTAAGKRSPFRIRELRPIQLATFDPESFVGGRSAFTRDEWLDLLLRSAGIDSQYLERITEEGPAKSLRLKLLFLLRLVPFVEPRFNLIELGPRGTGKSFVYREISPYSILISGGGTTTANLFYNMQAQRVGLVGLWDVVAFDEVAGVGFKEKDGIQILKDYMESGSFVRGKEVITANASMVFVGNLDKPTETLVKTHHLFEPLSEAMQDAALIDRLHCYLPGWEMPKLDPAMLTSHYGFIVDYLAEAFRSLRKLNFAEIVDRPFAFGSHLNKRDDTAVRRCVAGLLKLLHPDQRHTEAELATYLQLAMECRRRVKEQLKKMLPFEYARTSFSYIDRATQEEHFVACPEEGGRDLIPQDPLAPGTVFTAGVGGEERRIGIYRIEVTVSGGTGKLRLSGSMDRELKESCQRAFSYIQTHKGELGIGTDVDTHDFFVEAVDLLGSKVPCAAGVAFFVAAISALRRTQVQGATVVLGDVSIQGNVKGLPTLSELMQLSRDNGARRVLVPTANRRQALELDEDLLELASFYNDPKGAVDRALGAR
ncbi:MAG: protease Lon-related BREX system protein BrxL [Candidatus Rokuibacteriota bacterium]